MGNPQVQNQSSASNVPILNSPPVNGNNNKNMTKAQNDEMDSLMNALNSTNGCPEALIMTVMASLSKDEMQLKQENNEISAESTASQTSAVKQQAAGIMASSTSEVVMNAGQATMSGAGVVKGTKNFADNRKMQGDYSKQIAEVDEKVQLHHATEASGSDTRTPQEKANSLEKLKNKRSELVSKRDHETKSHRDESRHTLEGVQGFGSAINKIFESSGKATAEQSRTLAHQTAELASDIRNTSKENEKTDTDIANQALSINWAQVTVAAIRG